MTTAEIILFILMSASFIAGFIAIVRGKIVPTWLFAILGALFLSMWSGIFAQREAYQNALKGNNPYEMRIYYELRGDDYIPTDTTFVKRKN